jgi:hypothetical protein
MEDVGVPITTGQMFSECWMHTEWVPRLRESSDSQAIAAENLRLDCIAFDAVHLNIVSQPTLSVGQVIRVPDDAVGVLRIAAASQHVADNHLEHQGGGADTIWAYDNRCLMRGRRRKRYDILRLSLENSPCVRRSGAEGTAAGTIEGGLDLRERIERLQRG